MAASLLALPLLRESFSSLPISSMMAMWLGWRSSAENTAPAEV